MDEMSELAAFTEEDIAALLNDDTFLGTGRYHAHEHPKAVLLAGQPGAGKTELSSMMTLALGGDVCGAVGRLLGYIIISKFVRK